MITCVAVLESTSPYSQGKHITTPAKDRESPQDYEERCWRDRLHIDAAGGVIIPPMSFKNCLTQAAKYLGLKIKGRGQATYSKHFEAGVLVTKPLPLNIPAETVPGEWLFVPSDGVRGGGKRVNKCFPLIDKWRGQVTFHILDPVITADVFKQVLQLAGNLIGIGRFRPSCNGYYGRFEVVEFEWREE